MDGYGLVYIRQPAESPIDTAAVHAPWVAVAGVFLCVLWGVNTAIQNRSQGGVDSKRNDNNHGYLQPASVSTPFTKLDMRSHCL